MAGASHAHHDFVGLDGFNVLHGDILHLLGAVEELNSVFTLVNYRYIVMASDVSFFQGSKEMIDVTQYPRTCLCVERKVLHGQ